MASEKVRLSAGIVSCRTAGNHRDGTLSEKVRLSAGIVSPPVFAWNSQRPQVGESTPLRGHCQVLTDFNRIVRSRWSRRTHASPRASSVADSLPGLMVAKVGESTPFSRGHCQGSYAIFCIFASLGRSLRAARYDLVIVPVISRFFSTLPGATSVVTSPLATRSWELSVLLTS